MKMKNTANRDTAWYGARTASLAEFMTPERNEVLRRTVAMRTRYMTVRRKTCSTDRMQRR